MLIRRIFEYDEQQHPRHGRDHRGGEPTRHQGNGDQQETPDHVGGGVEPGNKVRKDVGHSMYPRPRNWSETRSSCSSTWSRWISFSRQLAMNSSTLLYPAAAA